MALEQSSWEILVKFSNIVQAISQLAELERVIKELEKVKDIPPTVSKGQLTGAIGAIISQNDELLKQFRSIGIEFDKIANGMVRQSADVAKGLLDQHSAITKTMDELKNFGAALARLPKTTFKEAAQISYKDQITQIEKLLGAQLPLTNLQEAQAALGKRILELDSERNIVYVDMIKRLREIDGLLGRQGTTIEGVKVSSSGLKTIMENIGNTLRGITPVGLAPEKLDKLKGQLENLRSIFEAQVKAASDPSAVAKQLALLGVISKLIPNVDALRSGFEAVNKAISEAKGVSLAQFTVSPEGQKGLQKAVEEGRITQEEAKSITEETKKQLEKEPEVVQKVKAKAELEVEEAQIAKEVKKSEKKIKDTVDTTKTKVWTQEEINAVYNVDESKISEEAQKAKDKIKGVSEEKAKEPIKTIQEIEQETTSKVDKDKVIQEAQKTIDKIKKISEEKAKKTKILTEAEVETKFTLSPEDKKNLDEAVKSGFLTAEQAASLAKGIVTAQVKLSTQYEVDKAKIIQEAQKGKDETKQIVERETKEPVKTIQDVKQETTIELNEEQLAKEAEKIKERQKEILEKGTTEVKTKGKLITELESVDELDAKLKKVNQELTFLGKFQVGTDIANQIKQQALAAASSEKDINSLNERLAVLHNRLSALKRVTTFKKDQIFDPRTKESLDKFNASVLGAKDGISNLTFAKKKLIDSEREQREATLGLVETEDQLTARLENSIGKVIRYRIAYLTMRAAIRGVKAAIQEFIDVQFGLAEIQKVLDPTTANIEELRKQAFLMAQEFGVAVKDVIGQYKIWAQMGLRQVEILKLSRAALLGVNTTGLEAAQIVEALTSVIFTYEKTADDAVRVVQQWMKVQAEFPVSAQDLVLSMEAVGSAAKEVGVDIEDLMGMVTAINAVTRKSGKTIGNSLKTMFARIPQKDTIQAFQGIGIAIFKSAGEFRDLDDVLDDLSKVWNTLTDVQRVNISKLVGGVRHYVDFIALMSNYAVKQKAVRDATFATDEAFKANTITMQTIKKQFESFKASAEKLGFTLGQTFGKSFSALISIFGGLVKLMGTPVIGNLIATLATMVSTLFGLKVVTATYNLTLSFMSKHVGIATKSHELWKAATIQATAAVKGSTTTLGFFSKAIIFARTSVGFLSASLKALGVSLGRIAITFAIFEGLNALYNLISKSAVRSLGNIEQSTEDMIISLSSQKQRTQDVIDSTKNYINQQRENLKSNKSLNDKLKEQKDIYKSITTIAPEVTRIVDEQGKSIKELTDAYTVSEDAVDKFIKSQEKLLGVLDEMSKKQFAIFLETFNDKIENATKTSNAFGDVIDNIQDPINNLKQAIDSAHFEDIFKEVTGPKRVIKVGVATQGLEKTIQAINTIDISASALIETFKDLQLQNILDEDQTKEQIKNIETIRDEANKIVNDVFKRWEKSGKTRVELIGNERSNLEKYLNALNGVANTQKSIADREHDDLTDKKDKLEVIMNLQKKGADPSVFVKFNREALKSVSNLEADMQLLVKTASTGGQEIISNLEALSKFGINKDILSELSSFFDNQLNAIKAGTMKIDDVILTAKERIKELTFDLKNLAEPEAEPGKIQAEIDAQKEVLSGATAIQEKYNKIFSVLKTDIITALGQVLTEQERITRVTFSAEEALKIYQEETKRVASNMKIVGLQEEEILQFELERKVAETELNKQIIKNEKVQEKSLDAIKAISEQTQEISNILQQMARIRAEKVFERINDVAREFSSIIESSIQSFSSGLIDFYSNQVDIKKQIKDEEKNLKEARIKGDKEATRQAQYHIDQLKEKQKEYLAGWFAIKKVISSLFTGISTAYIDSLTKRIAEDLSRIKIGGLQLDQKIGIAMTAAGEEHVKKLREGLLATSQITIKQVEGENIAQVNRQIEVYDALTTTLSTINKNLTDKLGSIFETFITKLGEKLGVKEIQGRLESQAKIDTKPFDLMGNELRLTSKILSEWGTKIDYWSQKRGLDSSLVAAIIAKESKGQERALGKTGDFGLMQITAPALEDFNKANGKNYNLALDMLDANKNLEVGTWHLANTIDHMKDSGFIPLEDALRAYNAGVKGASLDLSKSVSYARDILKLQSTIIDKKPAVDIRKPAQELQLRLNRPTQDTLSSNLDEWNSFLTQSGEVVNNFSSTLGTGQEGLIVLGEQAKITAENLATIHSISSQAEPPLGLKINTQGIDIPKDIQEQNKLELKKNTKALVEYAATQILSSQLLFRSIGRYTATMQAFATVFSQILPQFAGQKGFLGSIGSLFGGPAGGLLGSIVGGLVGSFFDEGVDKPIKDLTFATDENTQATIENTNTLEQISKAIFNAPPNFTIPSRLGGFGTSGGAGGGTPVTVNFQNSFTVAGSANAEELARVIENRLTRQFKTAFRITGSRGELVI